MIVRCLLGGLFSLGRRPVVPTLRPSSSRRTHAGSPRPLMPRGRPDLLLLTGAVTAPPSVPPRVVRGRTLDVRLSGRRWAA
ncbi:hypothetical protein [Rhodospira trueperi]|uniref:Uncharacterized protein n=1 Tax=Rhodospira trueperi TaxID=69960 RepID=A0A1G7A229_9PROT|nr:hypothetical protein [Rhodospira trueperi]SDE09008.1 hypothetical protein SAMN05421720_103146 [Rhodospira trueperi]